MQPRRRKRVVFVFILATLVTSGSVHATNWTASRDCFARCHFNASLCLVPSTGDRDCFALTPSETSNEWRVALEATDRFTLGALNLSLATEVQTLKLEGHKTHIQFDVTRLWTAPVLTSLVLSGLNLSMTTLPALPRSVKHVQITDCVLAEVPVKWLLTVPHLETLVLHENLWTKAPHVLLEISDKQWTRLRSQVMGEGGKAVHVEETQARVCTDGKGGTGQRLSGWPVCVTRDRRLRRRLVIFESLGSGGSDLESGSTLDDDDEIPTLMMLSVSLPCLYFVYKMGLFIFFMRTYGRYCSENGAVPEAVPDNRLRHLTHDSDESRYTTNDSSTSPLPSPSPRIHQRRKKQPLNVSSSQFWVNEELQPWRLDFKRLNMLKCLNLLSTEKRRSLRKQSIMNAMNPREIWLASLAINDASVAAASPGGGINETLVVVKYLAPKGNEELSPSHDGDGSARDKLKRELKRQATFSHPQVVTFIGVAWSLETHLCGVTEYMAQGDLRQWLRRTAGKESGQWSYHKVNMVLDVSKALLYLHSMQPRLVHGNCNSRNVLLDQSLRAKLSDFGQDGRSEALTEEEFMSYSAVGSGRWISPEALLGRETSMSYPDAGDVYSLGILIAEMDSHELPFSDLMQANKAAVPETDILQLIARGALSPTLSPSCPKRIVKLVTACTSYKPECRPSSAQVHQDLLHILEDFREFESQTTATISAGAPRSNPPSQLV
uniref:Protein kinase domain-containing protein n=1 Tax=Hyaloperonospora arabidopsidis (strain Emoy2) TaxID=559515 RepID=M4B9N5_HYAAE